MSDPETSEVLSQARIQCSFPWPVDIVLALFVKSAAHDHHMPRFLFFVLVVVEGEVSLSHFLCELSLRLPESVRTPACSKM